MRRVRSFFVVNMVLLLSDWTAGWALAAGPQEVKKPDIFDLRLDLGLWSIVVFLGLFFILRKYAWGPILHGLEKREQNILSAIEEAQRARLEAQQMHDRLQQQLDRAGEEVNKIMEKARLDGQHLMEEMVGKARGEIQTERERAHREIEMAKDQAFLELRVHTIQLATLISAKAIRRQISEEDHRHLLDEALSELGQAGADWQRQSIGGPL
jgi:F-type H+-transporting ATPase subunit b